MMDKDTEPKNKEETLFFGSVSLIIHTEISCIVPFAEHSCNFIQQGRTGKSIA